MKKFPLYGRIGIFFIIIFWYLNWNLSGLRTQWGFFFLWLGYILTIDGIVAKRKGSSLINRSVKKFILLFFISAPTWWLFELLNMITKNWQYLGRQYFSDLQYFLLASLSFSTVMPAVFETAELVSTFKIGSFQKFNSAIKYRVQSVKKYFISGWIILLLIIVLPEYFYPLIWIALFFIIDPINYWVGNKSLMSFAREGNWYPYLHLATGTLICGFFWEMWNYYSYPKWIYNLPHVNIIHIFEMPLPGYIGYIPFSFELYSIYILFISFSKKDDGSFLQIS